MSISVFARRSLLSLKALRLYERMGLLTPVEVDPRNGYRVYDESQLGRARLIVMLRRLDMPLAQIAQVLGASDAAAARLLADYWDGVEQRLAGQRELASYLQRMLAREEGKLDMFDIAVRDIPDQLVLTEKQHVTIGKFPGFMEEASGRLIAAALELGGLTGHVYVVYHGQVDEDNDGPVEVCVPIHHDRDRVDGIQMRFEPAHREAFSVLRKAQFQYPQILAAYDAVAKWCDDNANGIAGPAREVYYPGFPTAGPDEEVAELAYPIR
jgi:DNA-binding transcriptional MerR regulator